MGPPVAARFAVQVQPAGHVYAELLIHVPGFQVNLEFEKSGDDLQMHFPITIATVPFRIPNSNQQPNIHYGKFRKKNVRFIM
jgi:hypothetical protein